MQKQFGDIDWQATLDKHREELARAEQDVVECTAYAEKLRQAVPLLEQLAALHGAEIAVPTTGKPARQSASGRAGTTNGKRAEPTTLRAGHTRVSDPARAERTSTSVRQAPGGGQTLKARILIALGAAEGPMSPADVARATGLDVKKVGILLAGYAKTGDCRRVGVGVYTCAERKPVRQQAESRTESSQPPAPTELAQRIIEGSKAPDPGGHDLERVGSVKRCRKCGESHRDSFDFPLTCRAAA